MSANNRMTRMAQGKVDGTGAAIAVALDFAPRFVRLVNETGLAVMEWAETMGDGAGLKAITAGTISFVTTGGVTPKAQFERDDSSPSYTGFEIGADTDLNVSAEVLHWVAWE